MKRMSVHSAVEGETVNASRIAGIAAMIGPTIGMKSSNPPITPSPPAAGTPSADSAIHDVSPTNSDEHD